MSEELRTIAPGETIAAQLVRDFILAALRHDAIQDVLSEQLFERLERDEANPDALAGALVPMIEEVLDVATAEDLQGIASCLIDDARAAMEREDQA